MPAPIALFVYNRLWHTRKTVEALQKNGLAIDSDLFVFSDGPKGARDAKGVHEVREYVAQISGFRSIHIFNSDSNKGLSKSITSGVQNVLSDAENIIVLEDDLVTSPYFLDFMNQALNLYKEDDSVISIHGYMYPVATKLPETFFQRGADCWGWATWKRGWALFEHDGSLLLKELDAKRLNDEFDYGKSYPFRNMLVDQVNGRNDSWAIRWYASAFLHNKMTLYPATSFVNNIGNDSSGTHSGSTDQYEVSLRASPIDLKRVPIEELPEARKAISNYFRHLHKPLIKRILGTGLGLFKK